MSYTDTTVFTMGMITIFATDLLISNVSSYFILRGTIPVMMLCASVFSAWYLSFEADPVQKANWPLSIVARNGYYILIILSLITITKWIRDPVHRYFIFIQDKRKRTILHQHQYRQKVGNKLYDRDQSLMTQQNSRSLLTGPAWINHRDSHSGTGNNSTGYDHRRMSEEEYQEMNKSQLNLFNDARIQRVTKPHHKKNLSRDTDSYNYDE